MSIVPVFVSYFLCYCFLAWFLGTAKPHGRGFVFPTVGFSDGVTTLGRGLVSYGHHFFGATGRNVDNGVRFLEPRAGHTIFTLW